MNKTNVGAALILTVALIGCCLMSGCGKSAASTDSSASGSEATTMAVQVTAIGTDQITATVGSLSQTTGTEIVGGQTQAAPSGTDTSQSASAPQAAAPTGSQVNQVFTAGTESISIKVTDATDVELMTTGTEVKGSFSDITVDSVLQIFFSSGQIIQKIDVLTVNNDKHSNGSSAKTVTEATEIDDKYFSSTGNDENALRVSGAAVTLKNITLSKSDGKSSDTTIGDYYGMNAGLLIMSGGAGTIADSTIDTAAANGNGVFAYGTGSSASITNTKIRTSESSSSGIRSTSGAVITANDLDIQTKGKTSPAIQSLRNGGIITVAGGSYVTNGNDSPAISSVSDIAVTNAKLTASSSDAVEIMGKGSVNLQNCDLSGNMTSANTSAGENVHNILLCQNSSDTASAGMPGGVASKFTMTGGSLASKKGDLFYVTNTTGEIRLSGVAISQENSDTLLRVSGNAGNFGRGTAGSNGATVTFTGDGQTLNGRMTVDSISTLTLNLINSSVYNGAINQDGANGNVTVNLDGSSTWVLTSDTYVSAFNGDMANVVTNGFTLYVNGTPME